jgi:hypothetical protein
MFNVVAQALTLLPVDIKTPHCRHSPDSAQHSTRAGLTRRRPVLVGFFVAPHQLAQPPRSRASVPSTIAFANRAHDNTPAVYSSLFCLESVMSFCSNRENGECSPTHFSRNVISLCEQLFRSILLPASVPPRPQSAAASATPKVLGWPRWEIGPMWFTFSAVGHGHLCLNDFTTLSRPATLSPLPHNLHVIAALSWPLLFLVFPLRCLFPRSKVGSVLFGAPLPSHCQLFRWGQAIAVVNDALSVFGGKTDPYNSYGYTSAPWNNDLLFLSLSTPFDLSVPPWQYISGAQNTSVSSQGSALAWHTLSVFNASFLIFGGNTGPLSSIVPLDNSESAQLLDVHDLTTPTFLTLPNNWAGEPQRRMRHTSASANGQIYVIGGEAADGSGNTFSTHYIFDPSVPAFNQLPTQNSPPGIYGHAVTILFDVRLLVFGATGLLSQTQSRSGCPL